MGYHAIVRKNDQVGILDLRADLDQAKRIMIGDTPDIPENELIYVLDSYILSYDEVGLKIVFSLKDKDGNVVIKTIRGIKEYEYDLFEDPRPNVAFAKYWASFSDEIINVTLEEGGMVQNTNHTYRFLLYK